jgi:hypothetical protein
MAAAYATGASAQSPVIVIGQVPLSDTDCDHNNGLSGQPQPTAVPPCLVNGTRTVVAGSVTRTVFDATRDRVVARFDVEFDGVLNVDGVPVARAAGATFPFGGNGPRDASVFFSNGEAIVDLQSSYTGLMNTVIPNGNATPVYGNDRAWFLGYTNFNNQVRSITVNQFGYVDADGDPNTDGEYEYQLRSSDPANIVNGNSVDLSGRFGMASELNGIRFGKLSGSATLASGTNYTPYPENLGAANTGIISPYALQYNVVAELTTQLDENGLITPKVEVKDGVEMNGSRVAGLGDGVAATDAVNKGQLDGVAAAAGGALANAAAAQGTANTALANAATAQGTADTALTIANQANSKADQALARVDQAIAQTGNVVGNNNGGAVAQATGNGAMAGGSGTVADGAGAIAFGLDNRATGNGAVAIGDPNVATGTGAVAIGADNTATGDGAVALGNLSTANGASAIALGNSAAANGAGNIALGNAASATGANSVALGAGSVATQANSVSVGAAGAERRIVNVAAGTAATDAVNKGQLDAEAAARQQFNLQMSQRLAVQETATTNLTLGLANEMSARLAADNALSQRIDAVATRMDQLESQMSVLDDRIASSTAVASALSGNAFLPDMKFNLTANVATYDGAHAGALQMGVLVSPNLALNAGVASGLNRRGKTAARAGVTIGF